jgi:quercetin dioxygenase-like cupin family protein
VAVAGCEVREAPSEPAAEANAPAEAANAAGPATVASSEKPLAIAAASADLKWGPCPAGMPDGCQIAVLHGDPAKPNSDILLKVPAGSAIAPHWHSSAERMVLVGGQLTVQYQGSAEASLLPGTYAYGPARLPHRADCRSSEPCTLFIAFEGPVDRHPFDGPL